MSSFFFDIGFFVVFENQINHGFRCIKMRAPEFGLNSLKLVTSLLTYFELSKRVQVGKRLVTEDIIKYTKS